MTKIYKKAFKSSTFVSLIFVAIASVVLFISILRTAAVQYAFNTQVVSSYTLSGYASQNIDYGLVFPGNILPGDVLWPLKALRDRIWILTTVSLDKKMELYLLLADKRLGAAQVLYGRQKYELATSTLSKAENYLRQASETEGLNRANGADTRHFVYKLILASFKHREVIKNLTPTVPDDVRNQLVVLENYPRGLYDEKINLIRNADTVPLKNPYEGL